MKNEDLKPKFYTLEDMTQEDLNKLALERNTFAKEISRLNNIINELEKYLNEVMESYGYELDITDRIEKIAVRNILNKLKELKDGKNE